MTEIPTLLAAEVKAKTFWRTYRMPIIIGVCALVLGVVLGHRL